MSDQLLWSERRFPGSVLDMENGGFILAKAHWQRHQLKRAAQKSAARKPATKRTVPQGFKEVAPPSDEALQVAKFAHVIGTEVLGLRRPVALKWFKPGEADRERGVQGRADGPSGTIWVRSAGHAPEFLCEIIAHELKHLELDAGFNNATRERICTDFGRKWSGSIFAAGRATDWDGARVKFIRESHPSHAWNLEAKADDVVISRESARVWELSRGSWRELLT